MATFSRTFRRLARTCPIWPLFKAAGMRYKNRHDRSARGEAGRPARQLLAGAATGPDRPARRRDRRGARSCGSSTARRCAPAPIPRTRVEVEGLDVIAVGRGVGGAADLRLRDRSFRDRERGRDRDHLGRPEHARTEPGRSGAREQEDRLAAQADEPPLGADRRRQGEVGRDALPDRRARAGRRDVTARVRGLRLRRVPRARGRGPGCALAQRFRSS